jgi:hypothetical protein
MAMMTIRGLAYAVVALTLNTSCAEMYAERTVGAAIEFTDSCAAGPHCVTGSVANQRGAPLSGVRCIAEWSESEPTLAVSDRHGLFAMVGLQALPRHFRFEKNGFDTQLLSVDALMHRSARRDAAGAGIDATSGGADATNGGAADAMSGETPAFTTPLIGEDSLAGQENEPDLDFGNGKTMRLLVTMRRVPSSSH